MRDPPAHELGGEVGGREQAADEDDGGGVVERRPRGGAGVDDRGGQAEGVEVTEQVVHRSRRPEEGQVAAGLPRVEDPGAEEFADDARRVGEADSAGGEGPGEGVVGVAGAGVEEHPGHLTCRDAPGEGEDDGPVRVDAELEVARVGPPAARRSAG
ncbi:hypothetical protein MTQ16_00325 [Corynebacterium bovis]|uniref:hypothetical protein n=1 Tax=Corynebacterium bovis TaxID=36808 RepID=UPI003139D97F